MSRIDVVWKVSANMKRLLFLLLAVSLTISQTAAGQANQSVGATTQRKAQQKKLSSKDDISAIGHRNIGKSGVGNWYSLESEISFGKGVAESIEAEVTILNDPAVSEYVNRIGQNLVRNSDAQFPFTILVIDSDEVNAFSLPGGFLYVNSGLIAACDGEAELASVLAHEIAHVTARHATRQMTRSYLFNLGSLPLTFVGGGVAVNAARMLVPFGGDFSMFKFSRGFEAEADYLGLEYLYAAGYDPQAFLSFLEWAGSSKEKTGMLGGLFSTHPKTTGRLKKGQQEIARILPPRESYVVNTSDFGDIKEHLLGVNNGRLRLGSPGTPTLRAKRLNSADGASDRRRAPDIEGAQQPVTSAPGWPRCGGSGSLRRLCSGIPLPQD